MKNDKALPLTNAELELTQRIQTHFPRGYISTERIHHWNSCPKEILAQTVFDALEKEAGDRTSRVLSICQNLTIEACDGFETFMQADDVFGGGIDFGATVLNLCKTGGVSTKKTRVAVHEISSDATVEKMLNSSVMNDLSELCLTQHQIKVFCKKYPDWLRFDGYGTLFLFKEPPDLFAAHVFKATKGLFVRFHPFDVHIRNLSGLVRLVVPQLIA